MRNGDEQQKNLHHQRTTLQCVHALVSFVLAVVDAKMIHSDEVIDGCDIELRSNNIPEYTNNNSEIRFFCVCV